MECVSITAADGEQMADRLSIEEAVKTLPLEKAFQRLGRLY